MQIFIDLVQNTGRKNAKMVETHHRIRLKMEEK